MNDEKRISLFKDHHWDKKEPGGRLNDKQRHFQEKSEMERSEMEMQSTQVVKIIFHKKLWIQNLFYGVGLEFSIPLNIKEIRNRIHQAFPELGIVWEEE
jgi:hypothetical protein